MRELTLSEWNAFSLCESKRSAWSRELARNESFYRGDHELAYLPKGLEREIGEHVKQLVIGLPAFVADAYETRLDIEGFRFPSGPSDDLGLWDIWQANNLDEQSQMGHMDAVSLGKAAVTVGAGDDPDMPTVCVESATSMGWIRDGRTGKLTAAVKRWTELVEVGVPEVERATLYLPGRTLWLVAAQGAERGWFVAQEDAHGFPVPVVPLANRPRLSRLDGVSEFEPLLPIYQAANKIGSDMMVSAEFHSMPRRWIFGMKKSDFLDPKTGRPVSMWSQIAGRIWANENKDVQVGQFPEADLSNFHNTIKLLIQTGAMLAALPPHYLTFVGDNPASADAIRSSEAQLVKRVERKHTFLGGAWEDVCRLALLFRDGRLPDGAMGLETSWRDPSTPTVAQKADATVKLVQAKVVPVEQARIDLGYTSAQRDDMRKMDADALDQQVAALTPITDPLSTAADAVAA